MPFPPAIHAWGREIIKAAWRQQTGAMPSAFQAQCVAALTLQEGRYGLGWSGAGVGSHNWGSVQALLGQPGFDWVDRFPDNTEYKQRFRTYPNDLEGCGDMIRLMRKAAAAELDTFAGSDPVWRALYFGHYYGGLCPVAKAKYGDAIKNAFAFTGRPSTTVPGQECEAESIASGQRLAGDNIAAVAVALNEPAAPRLLVGNTIPGPGASGDNANASAGGSTIGIVGLGVMALAAWLMLKR